MPSLSKNCLLTVATVSHLHWAKVWSDSMMASNPQSDVLVFVLDAKRDAVAHLPFSQGVRLMGAEDLSDPALQQARRYFSYMEFCCASKSFALEHALFELGYDTAIYLDNDIFGYAPLDDARRVLETHVLALSPHVVSSFPDDGQRPNELDLVQNGFINGGILAARRDDATLRMLAWLKARCIHRGFYAPSICLCADQTWLSCLPWLYPESVTLLRHPGLNAAYWNLHERRLAAEDGILTSNGQPLVFLHYSGFDPATSEILTKYPSRPLSRENMNVLRPLMKEYAQRLQVAEESLPRIAVDFPCSSKSLWGRFRDYRRVHGAFPTFARQALFDRLAERLFA